jgi:hypothetical protein
VTVDLFRAARGRTVGDKLVRKFSGRRASFRWLGGGSDVRNGSYHARFTTRTASGGRDVRRVALQRRKGRWLVRPAFYRRVPCALVETFKLSRPVFGGRRNTRLGVSFRLNQAADVEVVARQGGRVVARFPKRGYPAGRTIRLRLAANRIPKRGTVRFTLTATRPGASTTSAVAARKL